MQESACLECNKSCEWFPPHPSFLGVEMIVTVIEAIMAISRKMFGLLLAMLMHHGYYHFIKENSRY